MPPTEEPAPPASTRILVEVWRETRERTGAPRVLRGWVMVLPDGPRRAFSRRWQLATLVVRAATGRPWDPRRGLRPR